MKLCNECGHNCEEYELVTCDNCNTNNVCRSCCLSEFVNGEEKYLCPDCVFDDVEFF